MKLPLLLPAVGVMLWAAPPHRLASPPAPTAGPCQFGRGAPIPDGSTWFEPFECYQSPTRHVTVPDSGAFEAGTGSGGLCLIAVTLDRGQIAPCGSFRGDAALTLPYSASACVIDDPRSDPVNISVSALFRR